MPCAGVRGPSTARLCACRAATPTTEEPRLLSVHVPDWTSSERRRGHPRICEPRAALTLQMDRHGPGATPQSVRLSPGGGCPGAPGLREPRSWQGKQSSESHLFPGAIWDGKGTPGAPGHCFSVNERGWDSAIFMTSACPGLPPPQLGPPVAGLSTPGDNGEYVKTCTTPHWQWHCCECGDACC